MPKLANLTEAVINASTETIKSQQSFAAFLDQTASVPVKQRPFYVHFRATANTSIKRFSTD